MTGRSLALLTIGALLAGAFAVPASAPAQCRLCASPTTERTGDDSIDNVRIEVQARLDFDQLVVSGDKGSGTARLLPDGSSSATGAVSAVSGRAMVGSVLVHGEAGRFVRITLPTSISLYGIGGGRIRLDSLVTDLPSDPRLDSQGSLQFRFGGAVHVDGDVDGQFRGDVPITVDYL